MIKEEVIEKIGEENWRAFLEWIGGQTVGTTPNGETDYFPWDVEAFERYLKTGTDRQQNPLLWD